jgi:hypothetical protein
MVAGGNASELLRRVESIRDRASALKLRDDIREHAAEASILYFKEYVDHWSLFGHLEFELKGSGRHIVKQVKSVDLFYYPSFGLRAVRNKGKWRKTIQNKRRFLEQRMLAATLLEAAEDWKEIEGKALLLIREVYGVSLDDEDFEKAAFSPAAWIRGNLRATLRAPNPRR